MNDKATKRSTQFVRVEKLKGADKIEVAAKHNLRKLRGGKGGYNGIDCRRTPLNYILFGANDFAEIVSVAQSLMDEAGIKSLRKDAVRAVEAVISLPPNSNVESKSFFSDSLDWVRDYFAVPVISAVVHCDQTNLHCHILIIPIVKGRMVGSKLVGNKQKLQSMHVDFNQRVGQRHGLTHQPRGLHPVASELHLSCHDILETIKAHPKRLGEPELCNAILDAFSYNRAAILSALKSNTLDINPIGFEAPLATQHEINPIGFSDTSTERELQSLSCVGEEPQSTDKPILQRRKLIEDMRKKLLLNEKPKLQKWPVTRNSNS